MTCEHCLVKGPGVHLWNAYYETPDGEEVLFSNYWLCVYCASKNPGYRLADPKIET